jgi:SAM-dependent methyltransferase
VTELDLTTQFDYKRLIDEEREHYSGIAVTKDLKEGGGHASTSWAYYWEHVYRTISCGPFADVPQWLDRNVSYPDRPIEILSLGSGYCGHELDFARRIRKPCRVHCTDLNEQLFAQARERSAQEGLDLTFQAADLNFIEIEPNRYDMIFAHAVLHHVINLERLYAQIRRGLTERGVLHLVEVVGQNRKLIWDDNERFANRLLDSLPPEVIGDHRLLVVPEDEGMEGIRQEEIMPLLESEFRPVYEHRHGAFMRCLCTNPTFAERLHPNSTVHRRCLDFLLACDDASVTHGILRPLEIWGVYRPN